MPREQARSLYGAPRPKTKPKHKVADSSTLSFASNLSSLLSSSRTSAKPRQGADPLAASHSRKEDIFSVHKRAKGRRHEDKPGGDGAGQAHQTQDDIGGVDRDLLHRSKRKMEEKARIYAAMKRGDYVDPRAARLGSSALAEALAEERGPLVDFDRKWAEGGERDADTTSDDGGDSEEDELVEYTDEFGRTRRGTRAEAARDERTRRIAATAKAELDEMRARPAADAEGSHVIFGDTVQTAAFNPDHTVSQQMAALAAKRDRSLTPPPDTHYDASQEIRTKGVGFYQFSQDKEARGKEMGALAEERAETARREQEREERRQKKTREIEERRKALKERRSQKQADAFLSGLAVPGFVAEGDGASGEDASPGKPEAA